MQRKIRQISDMPKNTSAGVVHDAGKDHMLEILIYENSTDEIPVAVSRFIVNWIPDEKCVDWLARVLAIDLRESYCFGKANQKNEMRALAQKFLKKLDSSL